MHGRYAAIHADPKGVGDARPTAISIIKDEHAQGRLAGKTIFITGCSAGIGVETARALATTGAHLFLTARDLAKAETALAGLIDPEQFTLLQMDQSSLASVRACAAAFLAQSTQLNILICNAGVMALQTLTHTADGHETQFGTNHLSHFLLFKLLQPALLASSTPDFNSRVVVVSSSGHRAGEVQPRGNRAFERDNNYTPFGAYGQSKTANIYMANEIDRRYGARGLHALSLHPGGIKSGLQKHVSATTLQEWAQNPETARWSKSTEQGAATTVYAAISRDWEGKGGRFLEDCDEAPPMEEKPYGNIGYKAYIYDQQKAQGLWEDSLEMVGWTPDD